MLQIEGWKRGLIWLTCLVGLLFALPNGFYSKVETYNDIKKQGSKRRAGLRFYLRALSTLVLICVVVRTFWGR